MSEDFLSEGILSLGKNVAAPRFPRFHSDRIPPPETIWNFVFYVTWGGNAVSRHHVPKWDANAAVTAPGHQKEKENNQKLKQMTRKINGSKKKRKLPLSFIFWDPSFYFKILTWIFFQKNLKIQQKVWDKLSSIIFCCDCCTSSRWNVTQRSWVWIRASAAFPHLKKAVSKSSWLRINLNIF